uniref:Uncharacterized protein n=1 Tax=Candidatus Kentrum sp. TC TaxID=2126339 RepID=A0A451A2V4_9GAMM|nr:MAG: hypothetical protein BECKTC1821F_GA0114240_104513 [Candidatus Kentron sp. TC]
MVPGDNELPSDLGKKVGTSLREVCGNPEFKIRERDLRAVVGIKVGGNINTIDTRESKEISISNDSLPIFGFVLGKDGNDCEVVAELVRIGGNIKFTSFPININYGLRVSSGEELPFEGITNAISQVITLVGDPATTLHKIITAEELGDIARKANEFLERKLESNRKYTDTISINSPSLQDYSASYLPMYYEKGEKKEFIGYVRLAIKPFASILTHNMTEGFPNYDEKHLFDLNKVLEKAPNEKVSNTLLAFMKEKKKEINSNSYNVEKLDKKCEEIKDQLRGKFSFNSSETAFILNRILSSHPDFNKEPEAYSEISYLSPLKLENEWKKVKRSLKYASLPCLKSYKTVLEKEEYGIPYISYEDYLNMQFDMEMLGDDFKVVESILDRMADAAHRKPKGRKALLQKSVFLNKSNIRIENRTNHNFWSTEGKEISAKEAAERLKNSFEGRIGCYLGLKNTRIKKPLLANGHGAYALYKKGEDWFRILIQYKPVNPKDKDAGIYFSRITFDQVRHGTPEPDYIKSLLGKKWGKRWEESEGCSKLLKDFPSNPV